MANVFNTNLPIEVRYDLKGSKQGRQTKKKADEVVEPEVALKDLDFDNDGLKISLDPEIKAALIKQMELDVQVFKLMEVLDYSLLLGIYNLKNGNIEGQRMLEMHDVQGRHTLSEKVAQVMHPDYGEMLLSDQDRFDFAFYESINGGMLS